MAEVNGKMMTCDRCGDSVFLQLTRTHEPDGGLSRWDEFRDLPDGWGYTTLMFCLPSAGDRVLLCPGCSRAFTDMQRAFWGFKVE